ncbi:MAG: hypothetical protein U0350_43455 [Caldilineaceae bacterium]
MSNHIYNSTSKEQAKFTQKLSNAVVRDKTRLTDATSCDSDAFPKSSNFYLQRYIGNQGLQLIHLDQHISNIQRKCACGGSGGPTGECEACKQKREVLQRDQHHQQRHELSYSEAAIFCDIPTLCKKYGEAHGVFSEQSLRAAIQKCRPNVRLWPGNPCLQPELIPSTLLVPGLASPLPSRRQSTRQGPNLEKLFHLNFNGRHLSVEVTIPNSLAVKLPIELGRGYQIAFNLNANLSGEISFSATLDGLPIRVGGVPLQFTAQASYNIDNHRATVGITASQRPRRVCNRLSETTKAEIQDAGEQLQTAMNNLLHSGNQSQEAASDQESSSHLQQVRQLVDAIGKLWHTVIEARQRCHEESSVKAKVEFSSGQSESNPNGRPDQRVIFGIEGQF